MGIIALDWDGKLLLSNSEFSLFPLSLVLSILSVFCLSVLLADDAFAGWRGFIHSAGSFYIYSEVSLLRCSLSRPPRSFVIQLLLDASVRRLKAQGWGIFAFQNEVFLDV